MISYDWKPGWGGGEKFSPADTHHTQMVAGTGAIGCPSQYLEALRVGAVDCCPQVTVPIGSCALQVSRDGYSAGALLIGLSELLDSALYTLGSCG